MKTYRLVVIETIGTDRTLWFRRTGTDRKYGTPKWVVVGPEHTHLRPTEWRTFEGVADYLAKYPHLREHFTVGVY